jgi:predicted dinucleotide-binding enzyme
LFPDARIYATDRGEGGDTVRIGVIGAGRVGGTLAAALARAGHAVSVGVRTVEGRAVDGATVVPVDEAVQGAEVVILALPGPAIEGFLREHGRALAGLVVVDAANSVGGPGPAHHAAAFAEHAPDAAMVRAFNTLGWENFADPTFGDERSDHYWCGPDGEPSTIAEQVISDVGLRPVRVGGPDAIDVVDAVMRLWFALVTEHGGRRHLGFRTLGL